MEPVHLFWAGVVVVVQPPAARPAPWAFPAADQQRVLDQVAVWLSGLVHGVQAARPLPAFAFGPSRTPVDEGEEQAETPWPGFYL